MSDGLHILLVGLQGLLSVSSQCDGRVVAPKGEVPRVVDARIVPEEYQPEALHVLVGKEIRQVTPVAASRWWPGVEYRPEEKPFLVQAHGYFGVPSVSGSRYDLRTLAVRVEMLGEGKTLYVETGTMGGSPIEGTVAVVVKLVTRPKAIIHVCAAAY